MHTYREQYNQPAFLNTNENDFSEPLSGEVRFKARFIKIGSENQLPRSVFQIQISLIQNSVFPSRILAPRPTAS